MMAGSATAVDVSSSANGAWENAVPLTTEVRARLHRWWTKSDWKAVKRFDPSERLTRIGERSHETHDPSPGPQRNVADPQFLPVTNET